MRFEVGRQRSRWDCRRRGKRPGSCSRRRHRVASIWRGPGGQVLFTDAPARTNWRSWSKVGTVGLLASD